MSSSIITKNALALALKKLMEEKDFEQISIADICNACDLNRKSFYYHFMDKYDLVNWIFYTGFFENVKLDTCKDFWGFFEEVSEYLYSERLFYKSAFKIEGQNSFQEYFLQTIYPVSAYYFDKNLSEEEREIFTGFASTSLIAVLSRWISDKSEMTPSEFIGNLRKTIGILANI